MTKERSRSGSHLTGRLAPLRFFIAHALLGAVLGYGLIHPTALIIFLYGSAESWHAIFLSAFTSAHLPMGLYFIALGIGVGGMNGALHALIAKLERQVTALESFIIMCASCKKVRIKDKGEGQWISVEQYLDTEHDQQMSHTVCRECARRLYPDIDLDAEE